MAVRQRTGKLLVAPNPDTVLQAGDIVVALGTAPHGIPFDSLDGKPATIIVLLVIPKGKFKVHVKTLSGIAKMANDAELRDHITNAASAEEIMGYIYEHDEHAEE